MWVKHPTSNEDGEVTIAGPKGLIIKQMISGVFDWPDELPLHNAYKAASAPAELILAQREADVSRLRDEAAKLGFQLFAPSTDEDPEVGGSESTDDESETEESEKASASVVKPKAPSKPRTAAAKE
ncbi:MAG: hypothetical protein ACYCYO_02025 [Bacilli bacterium]